MKSHGLDEALKIARLEYDNIIATHKLAADLAIRCESHPCYTVDVVYDEHAFQSGMSAIEMMMKAFDPTDGAADYTVYSASDTAKEFLCPGAVGAFKYPAGSISAYKFTIGLLKLCIPKGLQLYTMTPVHSVSAAIDPPAGWGGSGTRYSLTTDKGIVLTDQVIFATNGYTPHLLREFQGKIVPLRGQITVQGPGPRLRELRPQGLETTYSFIYDTGYEYMIPRPSLPSVPPEDVGDIIIGGGIGRLPQEGLIEFGNTDDTVLNLENSAYLKETLKVYFGENWGEDSEEMRVKKEWTGIMGITADGLPYVGEMSPGQGFWISAGFNGHGMVLCLKCAEALTHMILGNDEREYEWFPESFGITSKRINEAVFEGRKGMKAPPELSSADIGR